MRKDCDLEHQSSGLQDDQHPYVQSYKAKIRHNNIDNLRKTYRRLPTLPKVSWPSSLLARRFARCECSPSALTAVLGSDGVEDGVVSEGDDVGAGEWLANVDGREKDDNGDAVLGALMGGECNGLGV